MAKGGVSFICHSENRRKATASHPKFPSQAPPLPLPQMPDDPWALAVKFMRAGALFSAAQLLSCHPGQRHNYPAQASLTGGQGGDRRV